LWFPYTPSYASKLVHLRKEWSLKENNTRTLLICLRFENYTQGARKADCEQESVPVTCGENPKLASLLAKAVCTVPITLNCSAVARIYNTEHQLTKEQL